MSFKLPIEYINPESVNSIIKNDFRIKDLIKTKIELKYFENDIGNVQKSNSFDDLNHKIPFL